MENLQEKAKNKKSRIIVVGIVIISIFLFIIVLFIVGIKFTEPKTMIVSLPETSKNSERLDKTSSESITILLGENNKIIYYKGALGSPIISPKETKYGENGIRKELILQNKTMREDSPKLIKPKKLLVIIKPDTKSTTKNLIDLLDEMAIANISTYVIVPEFTPEETKLLASK